MKARLKKIKDRYGLIFYNKEDLLKCEKYVTQLSHENCQAIERGYDLDELAENILTTHLLSLRTQDISERRKNELLEISKLSFQKALEILGDKKFTEKDLEIVWDKSPMFTHNPTPENSFKECVKSLQTKTWEVEIKWETDEPTPFQRRTVIRKLDNQEEIEWTCFWDNGWWDNSGIRIPNVVSWERLPILDKNKKLILTISK